jgi:hypothetical protein
MCSPSNTMIAGWVRCPLPPYPGCTPHALVKLNARAGQKLTHCESCCCCSWWRQWQCRSTRSRITDRCKRFQHVVDQWTRMCSWRVGAPQPLPFLASGLQHLFVDVKQEYIPSSSRSMIGGSRQLRALHFECKTKGQRARSQTSCVNVHIDVRLSQRWRNRCSNREALCWVGGIPQMRRKWEAHRRIDLPWLRCANKHTRQT